jgi:hypothetical protein
MDDREALATAREIALSRLPNRRQGTFVQTLFPLDQMPADDLRCVVEHLADVAAALATQVTDLRRSYALQNVDPGVVIGRKADELQRQLATSS